MQLRRALAAGASGCISIGRCPGSDVARRLACLAAALMAVASCGEEFSGGGGSGGEAGSRTTSTPTTPSSSTTTETGSSTTATITSSCEFDACAEQPVPEQRGCNDCVESVCGEFPDCCDLHWIDACVRAANYFCGGGCELGCEQLLPPNLPLCSSPPGHCWVTTQQPGSCAALCRLAGLECETAWQLDPATAACEGGSAVGCDAILPIGMSYSLRCDCRMACGAELPCPPLWQCTGEPLACVGLDGT